MDYTGRNILITGSSRGIGKAIATQFAQKGARVAIHYRSGQSEAQAVFDALPGTGHLLVQGDVADPHAIQKMVNMCVQQFGTLDTLINNAGIFLPHPIDEVDYNTWQTQWLRTIQVNLTGAANLCYCAAQEMIKHKWGRIINITSRGAFRGEPNHPAYGASKAGLNALSQSLAVKLAPYNIGVFAVAPGFIETDMAKPVLEGPQGESIRQQSPLNRVGLPREVAHAVLFYASSASDYLTGGILDINGASYLRS